MQNTNDPLGSFNGVKKAFKGKNKSLYLWKFEVRRMII